MAEKKFSDLTTASQINETDIAAISQENNGVLGSFKATIGAIGQKIITGINFANAFNTNAKTVAGAVNEKLTSNAVADIEVSPAESAHSEGDYLIYNGLLYLVIDDIAIGDALATGAGGNIEIAQIADGIGGAGHDILNDAGSTLPKEGKLQFVGVYVHDDSLNGKTVVENYREMTAAEYAQLTAEQKKGLINVTDEQGHPITASATGFDNTGTSYEGNNVQDVLEEVDSNFDTIGFKKLNPISSQQDITINYSNCVQIDKTVFVDMLITADSSSANNRRLVGGLPETVSQDDFQFWGTEVKAYPNFSTTPIGFRIYNSNNSGGIYPNTSISAGKFHIYGSYITS